MSRKRIALLGGGFILPAHAAGFRAAGELCEVVAVAVGRPALRRQQIHELFGPDVRIESDWREAVNATDVDAVDILLPHDLHAPATIAAAEAGKPVLVEKVMARNVAECDRMIDACARAGVTLTVLHDRRYEGQWAKFKQVIDSGILGELFYWKLEHNQNVVFPEDHWVRSADRLGGGAIMSCLTHQIDMLRYCGGEVARLGAVGHTRPERMEGELVGVLAANMHSGAVANLSINWFTRSHAAHDGLWYELIHACGTKGEAYCMSNRGTYVLLHEPSDKQIAVGAVSAEGFVRQPCADESGHRRCIIEWVKSLHGLPAQVVSDGRDARATVEVAQAAYESIRTGCIVQLPLAGKRS